MSTIDKEKFQFVKRDDFASEAIDLSFDVCSFSICCKNVVFPEPRNPDMIIIGIICAS